MDKLKLDGKRAVITGAGRGIGLASAQALSEAGARVVLTDLSEELLASGRAALAAAGHEAETFVLDVTRPGDVTDTAARIEADLGPVDIVIANAGLAWDDTGAEDVDDALWLKLLDVNLNGAFWTCRAFARKMLERRRGAMVTLGSMSGLISNKPQRQVHYNSAKAAVHHMTRSLAGEWAERGVRVNCVAPTYVDTAMSRDGIEDEELFPIWMENTPMRRVAEADEIASAIHFLASDAASAITGSVLVVDCGYTIW
ncbi:MAG: SDR family NAD(P)-dependent oxidoreductase [Tropicimonas sp.]|uniref:SDR family NAD(P)-dependent oxidoreductase n=1 Tax=Tropicimonas sp. TaxID=2067044 RepID=UPI003A850D6D